ncbi:MAG: glycoside hydrolase family 32 protein [Spirochaetaceae bacterium]|jgi:beta-fructofuranosidase|nr:glycoside hydrolase family 32 protein [Spirochaetaceae bacterium]
MDHQGQIKKAEMARKINDARAKAGYFRQHYHFMAPSGWINDPNGLIYWRGEYHLFYQHNPYSAKWAAMHWGHAVSKDMVHWRHLPIALAPSESYDTCEKGGCFSGSAIDDNGVLSLFYTGVVKCEDDAFQTQCLARSTDGIHFEKHTANPVIAYPPISGSHDFRDPKVWRYGNLWCMVCGTCKNKLGKAVLYKSRNLEQWEYAGILAESVGNIGDSGYWGRMWECPDVFPLYEKWVLIFSPVGLPGRKCVYMVGGMDYKTGIFSPETSGEIDWGFDYYAPQSFMDKKGQRVLIAWQNSWDWMQGWHGYGPVQEEYWCGCMTIPRTITLDDRNRLISRPITELEILRNNKQELHKLTVTNEKIFIFCTNPVSFEMFLEINLLSTSAKKLHLVLRSKGDKYTSVTIDFSENKLIFERSHADDGYSHGMRECTLPLEERICTLRVFSDTTSVELFFDNGRTCMSNNIYPDHDGQEMFLFAEGGTAKINTLVTWELKEV